MQLLFQGTPTLNSFVDGLKREFKNAVDQVNASVPLYDLPKHWMGVEMTELQSVSQRERQKCFISRRTQHILSTVIWRQTYG